MPRTILIAICHLALVAGVVACGGGSDAGSDSAAGDRPVVVASTQILGDVVAQVAGDAASVVVLMGPGVDPHEFQPSARQAAQLRTADLVVVNGLGLEAGLASVLESAVADGADVFEVAPELNPIPLGGSPHDESHEDDEPHEDAGTADDTEHLAADPHVWMDPSRMAEAAALIGRELAAAIPDAAETIRERAGSYRGTLLELDQELESMFSALPADRRTIVTNHEALGYLADRFDFEVVGVVIPGGSTLAEPSSEQLSELVTTMEERGIDVIFGETTTPARLAEAVAGELGSDVEVVRLYTEGFGDENSGVVDYVSMMRTNGQLIVDASRSR